MIYPCNPGIDSRKINNRYCFRSKSPEMATQEPTPNKYQDVWTKDGQEPAKMSDTFKALVRRLTAVWKCSMCTTLLPADINIYSCRETLGQALVRLDTYWQSSWLCKALHMSEYGYRMMDLVSVRGSGMICPEKSMDNDRPCTSNKVKCVQQ